MYIHLTARRLALAAALVLAGALAPLAYSALGKPGNDAARPLASPVGAASVATAQAPTAVADNPYQFILPITTSTSTPCSSVPLPNGVDFVLESVAVFRQTLGGTPPTAARISPFYKVSAQESGSASGGFDIPLDATGDGTRAFNLVIRPDTMANAALGEIWQLYVCIDAPVGGNQMHVAFTGQLIRTTPTANLVLDFHAHGGSSGTTLRWTTGSETEIVGFNVWRYRNGKGVKVNRSLIRAKRSGRPAGARYTFVDRRPGAKRGLTYRLQIVGKDGRRTWHAAFAVV